MSVYLATFASGDQFILRAESGEVIVQRVFGHISSKTGKPYINNIVDGDWHDAYCAMREKLQKVWSGGRSGPRPLPHHFESDFQANYVGSHSDITDEIASMLKCI